MGLPVKELEVKKVFNEVNGTSKQKKKRKKKWLWFLLFGSIPLLPMIATLFLLLVIIFIPTLTQNKIDLSEYGATTIPAEYIPIYQEAGEKYGVEWILIAAIHKVETNFSQNLAVSSAGAIGHTQFMKCTWLSWRYPNCSSAPESVYTNVSIINKYGGYGVDGNGNGKADPWELEDSIYATAKYLSANMTGNTLEEKMRNAIYAYNHADWYVERVLTYYEMFKAGGGTVVAEIKGDKAWPVPYTKNLTSYFGLRNDPTSGKKGVQHNGIDISSGGIYGTPIVAFADGIVTYSQFNTGGYGYLVIIDHGNNVKTYYAHMKQQGIPIGSQVKAGQVIGYVGSTGNSTGPHLHFEVRVNGQAVDPMPYVSPFLN